VSSQGKLGHIDRIGGADGCLAVVRLLLLPSWALAAVGYFGPWLRHATAALTLSGVDMGEFTKFLPQVMDGSLGVVRQAFYAPPFAVVVSVAFLIGAQRLRYPWLVRIPALVLAVPVSLQLLPPAWSPASLMMPEFRAQTIALLLCWLLLAGFWLLGRLPGWLTGSVSATLSLAAAGLSIWQFLMVKPAIDQVYHVPPRVGWGFLICEAGLALVTAASAALVWHARRRSGGA